MLAAIWSDIDRLLLNTKENEEKPVNINFCRECSGVKVYSHEGLPTCSECGLVDSYFIDESAEWTSGMTDDGKVNDGKSPSLWLVKRASFDSDCKNASFFEFNNSAQKRPTNKQLAYALNQVKVCANFKFKFN